MAESTNSATDSTESSMIYNTVIRNFIDVPFSVEGVQGRLLLSDLRQVPHLWMIRHRGKALDRATDLSKIICGPKDPIQIIPILSPDVGVITVHVRYFKSSISNFKVTKVRLSRWLTVADLKVKFAEIEGIPADCLMNMLLFGYTLEDGRTLNYYSIENRTEVNLNLRGCVSDIPCVNVRAIKKLTGRDKPATYSWEGYTIGLNLYGFCPNKTCISNTIENGPKEVVVHARYGVVQMSGARSTFQCPACDVNQEAWFCPNKFVVSYARSLFRYKKSGVGQPIEEVLMQSFGTDDQFKTFDDKEGMAEYDCIQIITVGPDSSPYRCMQCDLPCMPKGKEPKSEVFLNCGHVYHLSCAPTNQDCMVCKAITFGSIMDFTNTIQDFPTKLMPIEGSSLQSRNTNDGWSEKGNLKISWNEYDYNERELEEKTRYKYHD